jgi:hypothetical protein
MEGLPDPRPGKMETPHSNLSRRTFLSGTAWALPAIYLFGVGGRDALAAPHGDTHTDTHTDGHLDVPGGTHIDNGHVDSTPGPPQHSDIAHQDSTHADGMFAGSHYDVGHSDVAHVDTNQWTDPHVDVARVNRTLAHTDVARAHSHADIHADTPATS